MEETWIEIEDYYEVSNTGKIYSLRRNRLLSIGKHPDGYLQVSIKNTKKLLHRLLAEAFIPNPDNLPEVNHINGIKTDNRLENLEWCTHLGNMQHGFKSGLINNSGENHGRVKLTKEQVLEIRKHSGGYKKIAPLYGVSSIQIGRIIRNETWKWL